MRISTGKLTMTEDFNCQASDLYRALTYKPVSVAKYAPNLSFDKETQITASSVYKSAKPHIK